MSYIIRRLFLLSIIINCTQSVHAMVYDNHFLPLLHRPRLAVDGMQGSFFGDFFMTTADEAVGSVENKVGIPELYGAFDQWKLAQAIEAATGANPLPSEWRGVEIPWQIQGKIQSQGATFGLNIPLSKWFSCGASWAAMRVNSSQTFYLGNTSLILSGSDKIRLDALRRSMFQQIGVTRNHSADVGFGDVDLYARVGNNWDYTLKFRRIDAGFRLGLLCPSASSRDLSAASSVPLGGNGHWGMYGAFDGLFEVKEDCSLGVFARLSKRFAKTSLHRLSVKGEPEIFGAVVGNVRVNPGLTFVLSPYLVLENLRKGLGVSLQYTLISHRQDDWGDCTNVCGNVPIELKNIKELSKWGSDYFTLNAFYDFGKTKVMRSFDPILSFRWDVPAMLWVTSRIPKTHRISVGLEFAF